MWAFYRNKSALQVKLIPARLKTIQKEKVTFREVERYGSIFLEAATGENKKYSWENKINFALGEGDLAAIHSAIAQLRLTSKMVQADVRGKKVDVPAGSCNLMLVHDPNANTEQAGKGVIKTFTIANAQNPGTYYLTISYTENKQKTANVSVGVSYGELIKLFVYIEQNQSNILGL